MISNITLLYWVLKSHSAVLWPDVSKYLKKYTIQRDILMRDGTLNAIIFIKIKIN